MAESPEYQGVLMWRDPKGQDERINTLPFEIGDLFNPLQERPFYFTASQVQKWIEHFAGILKEWMQGLHDTVMYEAVYDTFECNHRQMWDTIDTLRQLLFRYDNADAAAPADAFEYTAFYAQRIARVSAQPGFLFDVPKNERLPGWNADEEVIDVVLRLFIVAVVTLREEGFFSELLGGTLPPPKPHRKLFIDNGPARLDWTGTTYGSGRGQTVKSSAAKASGRKARAGSKSVVEN